MFTLTPREQNKPVISPPIWAGIKDTLPFPDPARLVIYNQHFPFFQLTPLLLPEGDEAASAVALPAEPWEQELAATGH